MTTIFFLVGFVFGAGLSHGWGFGGKVLAALVVMFCIFIDKQIHKLLRVDSRLKREVTLLRLREEERKRKNGTNKSIS